MGSTAQRTSPKVLPGSGTNQSGDHISKLISGSTPPHGGVLRDFTLDNQISSPTTLPTEIDNEHSNSLNNFISSFQRAQSFIGGSINEFNGDIDDQVIADDEFHNETTGLLRMPTNKSRRSSILSTFSAITGNSTFIQTVFNSINILVGVAILSLPYAMKLSGVIFGSLILLCCYLITLSSAKILGSILKRKPHLITYGDIGGYAFGSKFEILITVIFILDMTSALLSLSILFSSSFSSLLNTSESNLKILLFIVMFILSFLPLKHLSIISLMGIISVFSMVVLVIFSGFTTNIRPGSLINPMQINWFPQGDHPISDILLSLGMFMAPWGGHPVFPELYKDMKHNYKYGSCCNVAFSFTFILDFMVALFALLMYGTECQDLLMKNLIENPNYPKILKPLFMTIMGIIPLSKMPLLAKPIITTYENYFNLVEVKHSDIKTFFKKLSLRVLYIFLTLILSLSVTSFGKVVALLGSAICIALCMILPYAFKLIIMSDELSTKEIVILRIGVCIGTICAILGTIGVIIT